MPRTATMNRETWSCATACVKIGEIVHEHGRPITRKTLDSWIARGLPSHQPGGPRSKRFLYSDEVVRWLNSRCSTDTPGQEVAA